MVAPIFFIFFQMEPSYGGRGNSNSQSFDWHMMYVNGIWWLAGRALIRNRFRISSLSLYFAHKATIQPIATTIDSLKTLSYLPLISFRSSYINNPLLGPWSIYLVPRSNL